MHRDFCLGRLVILQRLNSTLKLWQRFAIYLSYLLNNNVLLSTAFLKQCFAIVDPSITHTYNVNFLSVSLSNFLFHSTTHIPIHPHTHPTHPYPDHPSKPSMCVWPSQTFIMSS